MPFSSRRATNPVITADKDRWVSDPKNTLRPDLEQQQDRVLDKLAEAWLFVLEMLVEEGADDK
jgi:hypothetical protein